MLQLVAFLKISLQSAVIHDTVSLLSRSARSWRSSVTVY